MATTGGEASISSTGALSTVVGPNTKLTYAQIEGLWIQQGGDRSLAPLMAAIAEAESGGHPFEINDTPSTGDYSVGLWQINYYNGLYADRAAKFGPPESLRRDPAAQARAANSLLHSQGLSAWTTYTRGTYRQFLDPSVAPDTSGNYGSSGTGTGATPAGLTSPTAADCLIPLPSVGSAIGVGGAGGCLITRDQGRQLLGGLIMIGGAGIMAMGVLLLFGVAIRKRGEKAAQVLIGVTPQGLSRRVVGNALRGRQAAGRAAQGAAASSAASSAPASGPLLEPIPKASAGANPPAGPARNVPTASRSTQQSAARLRKQGPTIQRGQPRGTIRP